MKKFTLFAMTVALLLASAGKSSASPFFSLLTSDNVEDSLSDESASIARDVNGNGVLDRGDVVQGIFELRVINGTQTGSVQPNGATVLGVVTLEVLSFTTGPLGFGTLYNFGAVGTANAANIGVYDLATVLAGFDLTGMTAILPARHRWQSLIAPMTTSRSNLAFPIPCPLMLQTRTWVLWERIGTSSCWVGLSTVTTSTRHSSMLGLQGQQ